MASGISRTAVLAAIAALAVGAWITTWPRAKPPRAPAPQPSEPLGPQHLDTATDVSFGTKFDDEEPEVAIVLKNTGGRVLQVESVETNCGCIRVGELTKVLEPGQSADVRMKIRLVGMSGPVERVVAVHTDDPAQLVAHVAVKGDVKPRLATEPAKIELHPESAAAEGVVDVIVTCTDGQPVAGTTAVSLTSGMKVTTTFDTSSARLHIVAAPFIEDFTGSIVLRRGAYERVISVTGIAFCDVRVSPQRLEAGVIHGATTLEGKFVARPDLVWKVVRVTSSRNDLRAEVVDGAVRATITDEAPTGLFAGMVIVTLEGAKPSQVLVAVTAFVER